ncbi:hypothetical protein BH23GEM10_BH23GEM10_16180 [soil metagenome]
MSRMEPGAVIVDQLRDRIVTGTYFGNWQPGERLPSIRDIADAEDVDRKTAAAAYHRLEDEGLVEVKPRSGVFLRDGSTGTSHAMDPLEQMQRRWLKSACDGGRALGLDTGAVLGLFRAVAAVEMTPLPVVDEDEATTLMIARELRACLGLDARPIRRQHLARREFAGAAMVVTTPYCATQVAGVIPDVPVITATLSLDPLHGLMKRVANGIILILVPSPWIADRVTAALRQAAPNFDRTRIVAVGPDTDVAALCAQAASVFVWPGCDDVLHNSGADAADCVTPVRLLSEATLDRVGRVVLDTALSRARAGAGRASGEGVAVSTSSVGGPL